MAVTATFSTSCSTSSNSTRTPVLSVHCVGRTPVLPFLSSYADDMPQTQQVPKNAGQDVTSESARSLHIERAIFVLLPLSVRPNVTFFFKAENSEKKRIPLGISERYRPLHLDVRAKPRCVWMYRRGSEVFTWKKQCRKKKQHDVPSVIR